jgi:hypothetical protein
MLAHTEKPGTRRVRPQIYENLTSCRDLVGRGKCVDWGQRCHLDTSTLSPPLWCGLAQLYVLIGQPSCHIFSNP